MKSILAAILILVSAVPALAQTAPSFRHRRYPTRYPAPVQQRFLRQPSYFSQSTLPQRRYSQSQNFQNSRNFGRSYSNPSQRPDYSNQYPSPQNLYGQSQNSRSLGENYLNAPSQPSYGERYVSPQAVYNQPQSSGNVDYYPNTPQQSSYSNQPSPQTFSGQSSTRNTEENYLGRSQQPNYSDQSSSFQGQSSQASSGQFFNTGNMGEDYFRAPQHIGYPVQGTSQSQSNQQQGQRQQYSSNQ